MQTVLLAIIAALLLIHVVNETSEGVQDFGVPQAVVVGAATLAVGVILAAVILGIAWLGTLGAMALNINL